MTRIAAHALVIPGLLAGGLLLATPAHADPQVDGVYSVADIGTNNLIAPGPDGNMWVTLNGATDEVARISPSGQVDRFDITGVTNPVGITATGGLMWITYAGGVASFNPTGIASPVTPTTVAIAALTDPRGIVPGPDGNLWTASTDKLFRIVPGPPAVVTQFATADTKVKDAKAIAAGGDGNIWVADGNGGAQVVSVAVDGTGTAYPTGGGNQGIAAGPGDQMGYSNPLANPQNVGRIQPGGTPQTTETAQLDPFGVTFGADGAYWFAQFNGRNLGRLTSDGGYTTLSGFPAAGAAPRQLAAGPSDTLWVTLDYPGTPTETKVARVTGVSPAPPPVTPDTTITKAPKAKVYTAKKKVALTFRFESSVSGSTFQCKWFKRIKGEEPPKATWKSCASPRTYQSKPGKYTLKVRAAAGGLTDPSPPKRTVKVIRS